MCADFTVTSRIRQDGPVVVVMIITIVMTAVIIIMAAVRATFMIVIMIVIMRFEEILLVNQNVLSIEGTAIKHLFERQSSPGGVMDIGSRADGSDGDLDRA